MSEESRIVVSIQGSKDNDKKWLNITLDGSDVIDLDFEADQIYVMDPDSLTVLGKNKTLRAEIALRTKYEELLGAELDELISSASIRGWRSSRAGEGKRLRKEIDALRPGSDKSP